jgi:hypothetical protein
MSLEELELKVGKVHVGSILVLRVADQDALGGIVGRYPRASLFASNIAMQLAMPLIGPTMAISLAYHGWRTNGTSRQSCSDRGMRATP